MSDQGGTVSSFLRPRPTRAVAEAYRVLRTNLLFTSADGRLVNTRTLFFRSDFPAGATRELHGNDTLVVNMVSYAHTKFYGGPGSDPRRPCSRPPVSHSIMGGQLAYVRG